MNTSPRIARQRMDRERVGGDVVALDAVAARDGADEFSFFVREAHGEPVDLRLDNVRELVAFEELRQPCVELAQFRFGIGVVEALHRLAMPVRLETLRAIIADALRR
jgi:hypothetical protein